MKMRPYLLALVGLLAACSAQAGPAGAFATGSYRNLFREYLGKSEREIDAKLDGAWQQFFHGNLETQRLYYPIADGMAYIPDVGNRDVRSEGMSYGMMICMQLDHQAEFNALWKFAKRFMYHDSGPLRGYFTWHVAYNGTMTRDDGSVIRGNGPAPDGEEWFVMALFFAAHRWGNGEGIYNYEAEAQALLHTMLHKDEDPDRGQETTMFDRTVKQIRFVPEGAGANFTDASYHLPAFYELWARWAAAPEDRAFLAEVAKTSRAFFKKVAHEKTGLMPNFSNFDGTAPARRGMGDEFREDAWRTLSNPALDWSWWAADPWEVEQSNRVLTFFAAQPPDDWPDHIKTDGTPTRTGEKSPGLYAMAAAAGLAADQTIAKPFVQRLWDMKIPDDSGRNHDGLRKPGELRSWRYYDGLLTMLALLQVSGHYRIYGHSG
jgi:oligosaccharide reducing-end xylanase